MTAVRIRIKGNLPSTRIVCDGWRFTAQGDTCGAYPCESYDAKGARKIAKGFGWQRVARRDYCPGCWPTAVRYLESASS